MVNKRVESFAKYAGLLTVCIEWTALLIYYLQMPMYFGGKYPISYFATLPETRFVFSICYTLAGICFWIFAKHHLNKHFNVPLHVFGLSMILFIGTALFPFDPNGTISLTIHSSLAYSSGVLFLAGMYLMAKHSNDKRLFKASIIAIVLSALFTAAFAVAPKDSDFIFTFEAGSWLMLQLWMIWLSFYVQREGTKLTAKNISQ